MALLVAGVGGFGASAGQTPPAEPPHTVEFLSRFAFHLNAEHLSRDDPRYVWDANFGGELDLVDYGADALTFVANYQAVLGEEIRAFDPNQGNYILGGSSQHARGAFEVAAAALSPVAPLATEPRGSRSTGTCSADACEAFKTARPPVDARADLRGVFMKTTVDYRGSWMPACAAT